MPLPPFELPVSPRITPLTAAIRREILALLTEPDTVTLPSATAQVAARWSARRRRRGDSPSAVRAAAAIVCLVGADLVDEVAAPPDPRHRVGPGHRGGPVDSGHGVEEPSDIRGRRRALVRMPRKAA